MKRIIAIAGLLTRASVIPSHATLFVRELWDNVTNGTPMGTQVAAQAYPLAQARATEQPRMASLESGT